jgi:hypothetical protein
MRALNLVNDLSSVAYPATYTTATGSTTVTQTTGAVTGSTHGLVLGDTITFDALNTATGGGQTNAVPPLPLLPGVEYWVIPNSTTSFTLATTYANAVAGAFIAPSGATVTTAAYNVNHYVLFNGQPYMALEDPQGSTPVFEGTGVPVVNYTGVTCTSASPGVFTLALNTSATLANGRAVKLGGNVPTGIKKNTVYYVVATSTNTFELAATVGGTAINTTSASTAGSPTTVYDVTGMQLGNLEASGEIGSVNTSPDSPFLETDLSVLVAQAAFLAANFVTFNIQTANDVAGAPDVPGAWTNAASLTQAGVGTIPVQLLNVVMQQYVRVQVAVVTDKASGTTGSVAAIAQLSASLLGN